jgi:SpoVK/Ycf46/Vps4 family AAA+-type ATPase
MYPSEYKSSSLRRLVIELCIALSPAGSSPDPKITFLAITNAPWTLPTSLRRRLPKRIGFPLPDDSKRIILFKVRISFTLFLLFR